MKPHDLLYWIVIALLVATVILLFANQIILRMLQATVTISNP